MAKIELYNMDCMEAMAKMPDRAYDLAIVDPPYGGTVKQGGYTVNKMGGKDYQHAYNLALWKQPPPTIDYFRELRRVSENQIIWGANHCASKLPFDSPCWIVWYKEREAQHWADCELAWASFDSAVKIFKWAWDGFRQGDMKNKEKRIHPTQKPVRLYEWLLNNYAKPGDRILDTHLGSGSSAIACDIMGYDFTGYEIDKEYYEAAKARLKQHQRQGVLLFGS